MPAPTMVASTMVASTMAASTIVALLMAAPTNQHQLWQHHAAAPTRSALVKASPTTAADWIWRQQSLQQP